MVLKQQTAEVFQEALNFYYEQKFVVAQKVFQNILQINPDDRVAMLYFKRSRKYRSNVRIPGGVVWGRNFDGEIGRILHALLSLKDACTKFKI